MSSSRIFSLNQIYRYGRLWQCSGDKRLDWKEVSLISDLKLPISANISAVDSRCLARKRVKISHG